MFVQLMYVKCMFVKQSGSSRDCLETFAGDLYTFFSGWRTLPLFFFTSEGCVGKTVKIKLPAPSRKGFSLLLEAVAMGLAARTSITSCQFGVFSSPALLLLNQSLNLDSEKKPSEMSQETLGLCWSV